MLSVQKQTNSKKLSSEKKNITSATKKTVKNSEVSSTIKSIVGESNGKSSVSKEIGKSVNISKKLHQSDFRTISKSTVNREIATSSTISKKESSVKQFESFNSKLSQRKEHQNFTHKSVAINSNSKENIVRNAAIKNNNMALIEHGNQESSISLRNDSNIIANINEFRSNTSVSSSSINTSEKIFSKINSVALTEDDDFSQDENNKKIVATLYHIEPIISEQSLNQNESIQETFTSDISKREVISMNQTHQVSSHRENNEQIFVVDEVDDVRFFEDRQQNLFSKSTNEVTAVSEKSKTYLRFDSKESETQSSSKSKNISSSKLIDSKTFHTGSIKEQCICEICTCG